MRDENSHYNEDKNPKILTIYSVDKVIYTQRGTLSYITDGNTKRYNSYQDKSGNIYKTVYSFTL